MKAHTQEATVDSVEAVRGLRVHLIGIGGAGMRGAAGLLLHLGAKVSGSDKIPFDGLGALVSRGARVTVGHSEAQLHRDVDLVVISAAIPEANAELAAARARGIRVIKYAELLGLLMRRYPQGVAIAGTHGKSTTTAMCAFLCREAGLSPSFLVGARSDQLGGNSGVGRGPLFVVEACEYDRSFLHLHPTSAAILNLEPDHLDCFSDLDEITDAFSRFAAQVDPAGVVICNGDDGRSSKAASTAGARVETFGFCSDVDWRAEELGVERGCHQFRVWFQGKAILTTRLSIPGRYNVSNALAAIALAHHAGAQPDALAKALPAFNGVDRRMTHRGEGGGITIVDDYAHHPTEVRVTIDAARKRYAHKRVWVIFQPHQNARTWHFMDEFAESFALADEVIVPDAFGAREVDEKTGLSGSEELVSRMCRRGVSAQYTNSLKAAAQHVMERVAEGDLVVTMGAGDVWKVADELVERICRPNSV